MAFDNLRLMVNSGEARYLKKTVGHALNQCITELIQVRPTDPVEYMGYWMRRYVDSRNYFQKKQLYYKELVAETSSIASMRLAREEHLQEAIATLQVAMNEAEHGIGIQTTDKSGYSMSRRSSMSSARSKGSRGVTTKEPESKIDEEGLPKDVEHLPVEDSNLLSEKTSETSSSSDAPVREGSKTSSPKTGSDTQMGRHSHSRSGGSSKTFILQEDVPISITPEPRPKKKSTKDIKVIESLKKSNRVEFEGGKKSDHDDISSNSSSTRADLLSIQPRRGSSTTSISRGEGSTSKNTAPRTKKKSIKDIRAIEAHKKSVRDAFETSNKSGRDDLSSSSSSSMADQFVVLHRSSSLEVSVASWKVKNAMIYCYHPVLGKLSPQQQRIDTDPVDEWMTKDPPAECFYDHELYFITEDLGSVEQSKRNSSVQVDSSDSDMSAEENRESLDSAMLPEEDVYLTLTDKGRLKRRLLSFSD